MKSNLPLDSYTIIVHSHSKSSKEKNGVIQGVSELSTVKLHYSNEFYHTFEDVTSTLTIKCLRPKIISQHNKSLEIQFTHESILILEPDWLVSVSDIVQCVVDNEVNTNLSYYELFTPISLSMSIVVGSLANTIFDELLIESQQEYSQIFEKFLRFKPLQSALLELSVIEEEQHRSQLDTLYYKGLELYDSLSYKIQFLPKDIFTLEPQFVSKDYSIVGRLDYMNVSKEAPIIDVVELKSSKAPSFSGNFFFRSIRYPSTMWSSHFIQVVCYQLLLESVYPTKGIQHSILYASENENFLRSVPITSTYKRVCLEVRNKIVSSKKAIISKKFSFHSALFKNELGIIPSYSHAEYSAVQATYKGNSDLLLLYFRSMLYFLENETNSSTFSVGNGKEDSKQNHLFFFKSRLEKKNSLYFIDEISITNWSGNIIEVECSEDVETSIRVGDTLLFYPKGIRPESLPLLKVVVTSFTERTIVLKQLYTLSNDFFEQYKLGRWCLEIDSTQRSISSMYIKLLSNLLWISEEKKSLLIGQSSPRKNSSNATLNSKVGKTASQIEAIEGALQSKDYFLIQGPPGTGKTSVVLASIVQNIIETTSETILIVAYTNKVVDELCSMILRLGLHDTLVRLGSSQNDDIRPYLVSNLTANEPVKQIARVLTQKRICISTVASIASNPEVFLLWKFQTVIFDEAAQIVEAYCIGIASYCDRAIYIGDEKQLPAIVVQNNEETHIQSQDLHSIGLTNLSESYFSRLRNNAQRNNWTHCLAMLKEQGRMHFDIQQIVNTLYYQNQLTTLRASQQSSHQLFSESNFLHNCFQNSRTVFFNIHQQTTTLEEQMLLLVEKLVVNFINAVPELRIGVITPYRKFNHRILQHFVSKNVQDIDVDTVERFQGSERDVIIFCVPVTSKEQFESIQSCTDIDGIMIDRKLNVAITRAKEYFVLCGSAHILELSEHYSQLLGLLPKIQWQ